MWNTNVRNAGVEPTRSAWKADMLPVTSIPLGLKSRNRTLPVAVYSRAVTPVTSDTPSHVDSNHAARYFTPLLYLMSYKTLTLASMQGAREP